MRAEQADFPTGFLGGPRLYAERHGDMDLRRIHAHLVISPQDAGDWLALMDGAIKDCGLGPPMERARPALRRAALMLVGSDPPGRE